jgi:hypothetical protein
MYINKDGVVNWEEILDNPVNYIHFNTGLTQSYNGGDLFWDDNTNSLSYKPYTINNDVTINLGQENVIRVFNNSGSQINNGKPVTITGSSSNVATIALAIASNGGNTLFKVNGVTTHDIPNNAYGFITNFGDVNDIDLSAFANNETIYLSQTIAGDLVSYSNLYFTGRTTEIGIVLDNSINGKLKLNIINETQFSNITQLESNILNANSSSTGLFSFSGISLSSPTTFDVGPAKGWIIDNFTNPIYPSVTYVEFNGLSGQTTPFLNTNPITYILLNSGGTLSLQTTFPTPKQRRQNIYLGKLGHANLTSIIQAFNEPDVEESPLSQVRDMFQPIRLINDGVYPSANGANLNFNTSFGSLYGFGINFINDGFTPNTLSVSGQSPCTFQYRTQTGGTGSNVTLIDPTKYDNNGVITTIGGGTNNSTNQRIFLTQNGTIRVQYGQTIYPTLLDAISASQTESFNTFSNFRDNGLLIGILSVRHTATDLSNTNFAKFLFASKFGETIGAAGGLSTTTLQQAYNNSSTPEIIINSTLDGLSIQNGSGNADNITNLLEGKNASGNTTSFITASGGFSGLSLSAISITTPSVAANANGLTATTISATTYLNLPLDVRVTGGTFSGSTAIFTNNTGGTFSVTGFSATGGGSFTGGTVSGATIFTNGVTASTLSVTGNTTLRAFSGTSGTISGSGQNILTVIGSGNSTTSPIFSVLGSSGELFSVTDSLTGSLFSVNDISGLPIVEVFSNNTILMGNYLAPSLNTTARTSLTAGTNTVYSIPTSAYTGAFIDYTLINTGNTSARAGNIMTIWNTGTTEFTEVSTNDIGSTTGITFSTVLSGSSALIRASATTTGWVLKTIIRGV